MAKHKTAACEDSGQTITKAIAEEWLKNPDSVQLSEFQQLDVEAATVLATAFPWLHLEGLKTLNDSAAEALAKFDGDLHLEGVASLSDNAVALLAKQEGILHLEGLAALSDLAAAALARHAGQSLYLSGLTSLSDVAAEAMSKHKGALCLSGLKKLSATAAHALAQHQGRLDLTGEARDAVVAAIRNKTSTIEWEPRFLRDTKNRFKELGSEFFPYSDVEVLLSEALTYGTSTDHILKWLQENDIYPGGDAACHSAVVFAWLVGAWPVTFKEMKSEEEMQDAHGLIVGAAEAIAHALRDQKT